MSQLMSESINELATALAKAQGEMPTAQKNCKNPYFKSMYADFESVRDAIVPSLSKYGLSFKQDIYEEDNGNSYLITLILHSSGQWTKSRCRIRPKKENDVQAFSSEVTYLRRVCLAASVGIATGDAEDDGNAASEPAKIEPPKYYQPIQQVLVEKITKDQLDQLEYELDGYPEIKESVLEVYGIKKLNEMQKSKFLPSMAEIRRLIALQQTVKNKN